MAQNEQGHPQGLPKCPLVRIPTYSEVMESHAPALGPSLFRPSSSLPSKTLTNSSILANSSFVNNQQRQVPVHRPPLSIGVQPGFAGNSGSRPFSGSTRGSGSDFGAGGTTAASAGPSTTPPPFPSKSSLGGPSAPSNTSNERSGSFSEAFDFVRQSKFYSPPPAQSPEPPSGPSGPSHRTAFPGTDGGGGLVPNGVNNIHVPGLTPNQIRNSIIVSRRQQGNPVLKHIRNLRWVFGDIVPDYLLGGSSCALYLSLRYHLLHPDYLYFRIRELQKGFRLRVVLCHVDVEDVIKPLHEVTKTALLHECTLLCAWSVEECARYLETIKSFENKPSDNIQERIDNDYLSRLTNALTTVRHVNKTDVLTLGSTFGSLAEVIGASMEDLAKCPGIGERKVKRLYDAFHEPFRRTSKQLRLTDISGAQRPASSTLGLRPLVTPPRPKSHEENAELQLAPSDIRADDLKEQEGEQSTRPGGDEGQARQSSVSVGATFNAAEASQKGFLVSEGEGRNLESMRENTLVDTGSGMVAERGGTLSERARRGRKAGKEEDVRERHEGSRLSWSQQDDKQQGSSRDPILLE